MKKTVMSKTMLVMSLCVEHIFRNALKKNVGRKRHVSKSVVVQKPFRRKALPYSQDKNELTKAETKLHLEQNLFVCDKFYSTIIYSTPAQINRKK